MILLLLLSSQAVSDKLISCSQLCCYDPGIGGLLTIIPGSGFLGYNNPLRASVAYNKGDLLPYKWVYGLPCHNDSILHGEI